MSVRRSDRMRCLRVGLAPALLIAGVACAADEQPDDRTPRSLK